jgi:proline dehydrogenase
MLEVLDHLMNTSARLAYIAGPELEDAIAACKRFSQRGVSSTIGYWDSGENADPREVADAYIEAMTAVHQEGLDAYLSIKAPPLKLSSELVAEVVTRARDAQLAVHFDSLFPGAADRTFELIAESLGRSARVGCTVPARWGRSVRDARRAVALGAMRVRVVKGQWEDPDHPGLDMRRGFLDVIDELAGQAAHVAVATHDPPLAREALRRLRRSGTSCELELLYGLPMNAGTQVAKEHAVPLRMYVPYGKAYMPYALSQLRKNPKVVWWFLRDSLGVSWPRDAARLVT